MSVSQYASLVVWFYFFATFVGGLAYKSNDEIEIRFASLEKQLKIQESEIKHQQKRIHQLEQKQHDLETEIERQNVFIKTVLESQIRHENIAAMNTNINMFESSAQQPERVAFTVYATKVIEHLGQGQPIKFDSILTNLGNSYNIHTGVFTVPVDGLYGFCFYIAEYNVHQLYASLVIDGQRTVQAIADGMHSGHDVQGGNFALLNLNAGQTVWLESDVGDGYIWASNVNRFESFSGFMLY